MASLWQNLPTVRNFLFLPDDTSQPLTRWDIIRLKNQLRPGPLDPQSQQLFYVALYDLERFRTRISEDKILDQIEVDPRKRAAAESDDTVLLEIGMEWVKQMVFNK